MKGKSASDVRAQTACDISASQQLGNAGAPDHNRLKIRSGDHRSLPLPVAIGISYVDEILG